MWYASLLPSFRRYLLADPEGMARWVGVGTQQPRAGIEPATWRSQVRHRTTRPRLRPTWCYSTYFVIDRLTYWLRPTNCSAVAESWLRCRYSLSWCSQSSALHYLYLSWSSQLLEPATSADSSEPTSHQLTASATKNAETYVRDSLIDDEAIRGRNRQCDRQTDRHRDVNPGARTPIFC